MFKEPLLASHPTQEFINSVKRSVEELSRSYSKFFPELDRTQQVGIN